MSDATKRRIERMGLVLGVLVSGWAIVTAARSELRDNYVTRSEYDVHQVRDSARWAKVEEKLNYTACRQDKPRIQCLP